MSISSSGILPVVHMVYDLIDDWDDQIVLLGRLPFGANTGKTRYLYTYKVKNQSRSLILKC